MAYNNGQFSRVLQQAIWRGGGGGGGLSLFLASMKYNVWWYMTQELKEHAASG